MDNKYITKVYLLNVPLENDYKNTLYFESKEAQQEYFQSRIVTSKGRRLEFTDFSYQRKDSFIRVRSHFDDLHQVNYVMYQNSAYSNKWFYAFITDIKYVTDDRSDLIIETDYMQTWLFDYNVKQSFVEREHVSSDGIGEHTIPEGLETGPYKCNEKQIDTDNNDLTIIMASSDYAEKVQGNIKGDLYGGIYSGMQYACYNTTEDGIKSLNSMIKNYDDNSKADAINSIFMAPRWLSGISSEAIAAIVAKSDGAKIKQKEYSKSYTLDSYTPRNKKLLCYPYQYLYVDNNGGGSAIYEYEKFSSASCKFEMSGVLTPGCSIRLTPLNYNGVDKNTSEGINGGKFPICCWNSDAYTNWLTSNGLNIGLQLATGLGQIVVGAGIASATGGLGLAVGGGSIAGGVSTIASTLTQTHQQSMVPDQVRGNTNSGDVMTATDSNCFMFYKMSIKQEFARYLDKYFDMFGYKVNMVKIPNKAHRSRYWFTKTIDVNIDGAIPNKDMQVIKDCYNKGITFWRNANEMQDYSLSNGIVG